MHTLSPGMVLRDGRPWLVHGSMGGEIQPQVFAQFVSAVIDGGLDIAAAVGMPRWSADVARHYGPPAVTRLEARFDPEVAAALEARGQRITWALPFDSALGHAHALELRWLPEPARGAGPGPAEAPLEAIAAATDPRSEGAPSVW
jgi:gamma-glutamyltranspeptidase/glutathione hydrolase